MIHDPQVRRSVRLAALLGLLFAAGVPLGAQQAEPVAPPATAEESRAAQSPPRDRHDPTVPAGAVRAFIDACRARDYARASARLDLSGIPAGERDSAGPRLARQLKIVLDQKLWIRFERISDRPDGELEDGLPEDLELIGTIEDGVEVDVLLQRVHDPEGRQVWKFSSGTVDAIPALYDAFGYGAIGEVLPQALFEWSLLEIRLAQWIGLALLVLAAWFLSWFVLALALRIVRPLVGRTRTDLDDRILRLLVAPARLLLALAFFAAGSLVLRFAEPVWITLRNVEIALALLGVTWAALRLVDVAAEMLSDRFERDGRTAARAVVPLGRRTVKVVLLGFAALGMLQNLGFNVTGLIAGLGVGGLAVALAAQKTVENLFGGVTLITDQPVRVGDFCRFADGQVGTVEEIGLRSTRIRTLERTVVSVPNSRFSELQLENFAQRDRIRLLAVLGLRYETGADQMRYVLTELRKVLIAHPRVARDPLRVRFVGFGASSLDVEVLAYVETTDFNEFCAVREDLYLRFMDVVAGAGTGFAFPSQTLYLGRDTGLDRVRGEAAERAVREWREGGALPFPDLPEATVEGLRGSLDYPPAGSPGGEGPQAGG